MDTGAVQPNYPTLNTVNAEQPTSVQPIGMDNTSRTMPSNYATPSMNPDNQGPSADNEDMPSKKQLKKMSSIEQAKDRAQVTAATSMSIVHVALLKDLLDNGPDSNVYYNWSLGLIVTALILQIIAGFISLYIALLRFYFTEYKDDFLDDCIKTCCPFTCKRVRHSDHAYGVDSWINNPHRTGKITRINSEDCEEEKGCCPFNCTSNRFAEYEYQIIDLHNEMVEERIRSDLQTANFDVEIKWLSDRTAQLKADLEYYKAMDLNNEAANEEQLNSINAQLETLKEDKLKLAEKNKNARALQTQGGVLEKHVERIQEERVLKRSTFWQNLLNMIMYSVFILNAMIAGFGLANPETEAESATLNNTSR